MSKKVLWTYRIKREQLVNEKSRFTSHSNNSQSLVTPRLACQSDCYKSRNIYFLASCIDFPSNLKLLNTVLRYVFIKQSVTESPSLVLIKLIGFLQVSGLIFGYMPAFLTERFSRPRRLIVDTMQPFESMPLPINHLQGFRLV